MVLAKVVKINNGRITVRLSAKDRCKELYGKHDNIKVGDVIGVEREHYGDAFLNTFLYKA